jgi:hypothetical protein
MQVFLGIYGAQGIQSAVGLDPRPSSRGVLLPPRERGVEPTAQRGVRLARRVQMERALQVDDSRQAGGCNRKDPAWGKALAWTATSSAGAERKMAARGMADNRHPQEIEGRAGGVEVRG